MTSKNNAVQAFLDDLEIVRPDSFTLVSGLRTLVFEREPDVNERIMYGGIMFSLPQNQSGDDFGGIFVYKKHISFEFGKGVLMDDPQHVLEGKGQLRRHLKIRSTTDIEDKKVAFFVARSLLL